MRLERLNSDKIKIFLTFDDLNERGITKEDMWHDLPKVQQLFRDMIMEADDELGFQAKGPIDVEVFSLPAQGMVVIVTKSIDYELFDDDQDEYIEMQVTLDETDDILYTFHDFEDIISLVSPLKRLGINGGQLYHYNGRYYLGFEDHTENVETLIAYLAEYGQPSTMSSHCLFEYGRVILPDHAVKNLYQSFYDRKTSH